MIWIVSDILQSRSTSASPPKNGQTTATSQMYESSNRSSPKTAYRKPQLGMSFALNFSVFFNLHFLNLFCNNKFWFFISITLIIINSMDYGLFSSWSTSINKHYFSDEYTRMRKQIRKVAHSVRTKYPNNVLPCIPKEEEKNAFQSKRNATHRGKPYGGSMGKQPPVSLSREIKACYSKPVTLSQCKSESLKRVSAWLENQPHSFMKRRTEAVVLRGIEAYYQKENASTNVLQSKSASSKKTSVKQHRDSFPEEETKAVLHEIEAYNHRDNNVRVLPLRKSVKKVSADIEKRPRVQEKETEAAMLNGIEACYRRDNEPKAMPRCKSGNARKVSADIEKQYRVSILQMKTEVSVAHEIEAHHHRRDNVINSLPLAKSHNVEKVSASLEKRPRVSFLQKEVEAIALHESDAYHHRQNAPPDGVLGKETEAVVLHEIQPCNYHEENLPRTLPRVKSATINKASADLERHPPISFLKENAEEAALLHINEAYYNRENVPTTPPQVKSRTAKKVVIDESKNVVRRIETEKRASDGVGYRQERNKYANMSCEELNCRFDEFIQTFNMQIRLQGQGYAVAR